MFTCSCMHGFGTLHVRAGTLVQSVPFCTLVLLSDKCLVDRQGGRKDASDRVQGLSQNIQWFCLLHVSHAVALKHHVLFNCMLF